MTKRLTTQLFITKAKNVYGDKYDYSKVEYVDAKTKVKITCLEHGVEFKQAPDHHLQNKNGCYECVARKRKEHFARSEFRQSPKHHLRGQGCHKCARESATKNKSLDTETFIERSVGVCGEKYDYSKTEYRSAKEKVIIICKEHNVEFQQTPNNHWKFEGCPSCNANGVSKNSQLWLDNLGVPQEYREITITLSGRRFRLDAIDHKEKIVYEYNGDWWHGNPNMYRSNDVHPISKKTYGELYKATKEKENVLKKSGYKVISIWESEWKSQGALSYASHPR